MINIKKEFWIDNLLDIFAFIDLKDNTRCDEDSTWLESIIEYADLIKTTKLTKDMFVGGDAIFSGWYLYITDFLRPVLSNGDYELYFIMSLLEVPVIKFSVANIYSDYTGEPKTLHDLAELTKSSPLKLK